MQVEVVSPEALLFSGQCTQVLARTAGGDIAFMEGHAPFIGALSTGAVRLWESGGDVRAMAVRGGFVEVSNNVVTILSDQAVHAADIDATEARESLAAAEAAGRGPGDDDLAGRDELAWHRTRLRVATGDLA